MILESINVTSIPKTVALKVCTTDTLPELYEINGQIFTIVNITSTTGDISIGRFNVDIPACSAAFPSK